VRETSVANIPSLTGIRGVAALWVMLSHVALFGPEFGLPWLFGSPVLRDGWIGVDLFFMLSGFILMYTHEADFQKISAARLFNFAWLRFFRIYPLATAVLLIILLMVALNPGFAPWYRASDAPTDLTLVPFIKTLFLATRWIPPSYGDWNQPVWSLSVEIIGYCALPWLAWTFGRLSMPLAIIAIAVVWIAIPKIVALRAGAIDSGDLYDGAVVRMAGGFVGGVALCRAWRLLPGLDRRLVSALAITLGVTVVALGWVPHGTVAMPFALAGLIFCLAYQHGIVNRMLSSRLAMFLGQISFPLYLTHVMALNWLRYLVASNHLGSPFSTIALAILIVGVLAGSYALHLLVERPSHRWARRWLSRRGSRSVAAPLLAQSAETIQAR